MKNKFYQDIQKAYANGASSDELRLLLGRARAKKGMFEGDLKEGELEIGQISSAINELKPAAEIVAEIVHEYNQTLKSLQKI